MKVIKTKLDNIQEIKKLCSIASINKGDVTVQSDKYIVNAKSLMGLFSLDLSKEVEIVFYEPITVDIDEVFWGSKPIKIIYIAKQQTIGFNNKTEKRK